MNQYQLVFILDQEDKEKLKNITSVIASFKGDIIKKQDLGKKDFSYKINHNKTGYYYNWQVKLDPDKLKPLTQKFNLDKLTLRYLIIKEE